MSVVLTVYSQNAYKEFVLPSIHNAEMKLHISAKMFRLRKDIELCLERMDNQWYLCASSDYIYENEGEKDAPVMLHHNAYIRMQAAGGSILFWVFKRRKQRLYPMKSIRFQMSAN